MLLRILLLASFVLASCASSSAIEREQAQRIRNLEEDVRDLRNAIATLEVRIRAIKTAPPPASSFGPTICPEFPPVDAHVLDVSSELRLVVLDKGKHDGVGVGFMFTVFLDNVYKGQVRVQSVDESTSTGIIVHERVAIAIGDTAATQL